MYQTFFKYNGLWYHSAEQAYMHLVGDPCGDKAIGERIMLAKDGYTAKEATKPLIKNPLWLQNQEAVLYNVQKLNSQLH